MQEKMVRWGCTAMGGGGGGGSIMLQVLSRNPAKCAKKNYHHQEGLSWQLGAFHCPAS